MKINIKVFLLIIGTILFRPVIILFFVWFIWQGRVHLYPLWRVMRAKTKKEIMDLDKSRGGKYNFSSRLCGKSEKALQENKLCSPDNWKEKKLKPGVYSIKYY